MNKKQENSLMGHIDMLSIVRDVMRQWWVILILSVSVSLLADMWVTNNYQPEYRVSSTFVVTSKGMNANIYQNLTAANELAKNFSTILESNVLKSKIKEELGMESFGAKTSVTILPETNLMELTVTADSAMEAYHVMKSIMKNYNSVSDYVISNVIIEVLQPPIIPMTPTNPLQTKGIRNKMFLLTAVALVAGLAVLSYMKDTVKNKDEVEEKIDSRLLGTIVHERKIKSIRDVKKARNLSMLIENPLLSFRFVESNKMTASRIRSKMEKHKYKILLVTSVMENEGKSTVAANIALALAQENNNVLLIDSDFRKPAQYKIFEAGEDKVTDLPKILAKQEMSTDILSRYADTRLYTLFNKRSTTNLEYLLENGTLQKILEFAREKMDYIIMDTSPLALVSDTEELAHLADATVLVVRQDMVYAKDINDAIDALNQAGGNVIGCVFNDAIAGITEHMKQYGYGSRYGYGHYGYGGQNGKRTD